MKKGLVLLAISLLTLPMTANALTGSVDIECAKNELKVNESTTCTIKGKSDTEINGLSMKISSNLELSEISVDKDAWQGDGKDGFIAVYTDENKKGDFVIGTFTVTSKTEGTNDIKLDEIIISDKGFNETKLSSVKETVKFIADTPVVDNKDDEATDSDKKDDITSGTDKEDNEDKNDVTNDTNKEENNVPNDTNKEENNDKESIVENPETGVALTLGMLGLVFVGAIVFAINNKKNYFYKI